MPESPPSLLADTAEKSRGWAVRASDHMQAHRHTGTG